MMGLLATEPGLWHLYVPVCFCLAFVILYVSVAVRARILSLWYQVVGCCPEGWEPRHRRVTLSPRNIVLQGGSVVSRAISVAVKVQAGGEVRAGQGSAHRRVRQRAPSPEHRGWDGGRRQDPAADLGFLGCRWGFGGLCLAEGWLSWWLVLPSRQAACGSTAKPCRALWPCEGTSLPPRSPRTHGLSPKTCQQIRLTSKAEDLSCKEEKKG